MAIYSYTARQIGSGQSQIQKGQIEAETSGAATTQLRSQNLLILKLEEGDGKSGFKFHLGGKRVPFKEKIIFTRQLAVMVKAGLSLVKALESLSEQTDNRHFKTTIGEVIKAVKGGQTLSKALAHYPKIFPEVYVAVVRAGEETGQLAEVLFTLADQQEKQAELISKVRSAMMYPSIIFLALIGVVFLIIFFVLPSLQSVFNDFGAELPLTTRFLFAVSELFRQYFYIFGVVFVIFIYLLRWWFSRPSGRLVYDHLKIRIPVFGNLTKKVYMATFSRTLSMLVKASLPILESIKIVKKTINNKHYEEAFDRIQLAVKNGKPLSQAVSRETLFPPMVSQLLNLGEESGNLESVLSEVTRFYDNEVETITKNLASLVEPIMLIVMGLGVAFVVASVLGPIYKLVSTF